MADGDLDELARLLTEAGRLVARIHAYPAAPDPAVRCIDCKRRTEKPIAVYDPDGKLVGYRGPSCHQQWLNAGAGVQLPIEEATP